MRSKIFAIPPSKSLEKHLSGKGAKNVLIVVQEHEASEKTFSDLLAAIKVDQHEDAFVLKVPDTVTISITSIIATYNITKVLSFGFSADQLGLSVNHAYNYIYSISNTQILMAENIFTLQSDKNKKITLWKQLQQLFLNN